MRGYLYQNAITPESLLLENADQLKAFVSTLPPVVPYKILPAPANPDPFRSGFTVDFEQNVIAVAVGRNRISKHPRYSRTEQMADGSRRVHFVLPGTLGEAYPYGWAVYTAVILPRIDGPTSVVVQTEKAPKGWPGPTGR